MYAKIFASLYQGTLRGNAHAILVFTNLLAPADREGCVDKHFRAIADEVGLSVDQVRAAIDYLQSPDPESRSPEKEGRRITPLDGHRKWGWQITNYEKYRTIRCEDDRRAYNREAQARHRKSKIVNDSDSGSRMSAKGEGDADAKVEVVVSRPPPPPPADDMFTNPAPNLRSPMQTSLGDLEGMYPALLVMRDDRGRMETIFRLYGFDVLSKSLAKMLPIAKGKEPGKRRIFVSELAEWLDKHYDLEAEDYHKAGLPAPEACNAK